MVSRYRKFGPQFREGAVRIVLESGRPVAQVARDLRVNEGALGNWVAQSRALVGAWIDGFYNRRRRRSACGRLSPVQFEEPDRQRSAA